MSSIHLLLDPSAPAPNPSHQPDNTVTLKRRASPSFDPPAPDTHKRLKEDVPADASLDDPHHPPLISGSALADDLEQELLCGCCAGLIYRPVVVYPCQHYFCGSCCFLWVRNGGSNCPACRSVSTSVTPSRALQVMVDVLLRADPSRGRTEREKQQADEIYRSGQSFRIPTPREASPEPTIPQPGEYARPCPHCTPGNRFGWSCPQPVPDPAIDPDHAWHIDNGAPPGHSYCGNCENMLAVQAPTSTKCDFCQVSFCGVGVQGRCSASLLMVQQPNAMSDIGDLIQSAEVYECFDGNAVEVEIMLDYLTAQRMTPKHIYRDIVGHISAQPRNFAPLIELDLFVDIHGVVPGPSPDLDSSRDRICRLCAVEVLLFGLKDWWIRERRKGFLEPSVTDRPDCLDGSGCPLQKEHGTSHGPTQVTMVLTGFCSPCQRM
ncbi:hypothetical protein FA95DRAFT_1497101 [Auriscalpium vulgare]|uniref:Uncharacterized protein n=1 Tax=Auriscalpium vulgare TaxID=40419 RepID=A0ACB8RL58_9AGAM|nr:hypothetical protein FA95DRAFT_1497101 [Auriscalpium vulgare]